MNTFKCFFSALLFLVPSAMSAHKTDPARNVIQRAIGEQHVNVSLTVRGDKGNNYFSYKVKNGKLHIQGSDNVALCRGFYDYVKSNHMGIFSWSGNNITIPAELHDQGLKKRVCPFENHYYFNVVTYGYTMPYWDWNRWEKEIDWMALHGVNMPLALVANEAISARVWSKLGLTDKEIGDYFAGPAHLPWMRMGNISNIDGPLTDTWHNQQIALQHKILKRMKELGMKPICPAFAGFVPKAIKRLYPEVSFSETTWAGAFHNWMLSPKDELFHTIGKMFIEEWEKEFGKNDYYIADSFNEMDIPFPPKDDPKRYSLLADYGERVYKSIRDGNKDAVWVMQGWMFGYMRDIWDYKTLQALVSKVPDDKMLILDLAVDYNKHFWHSEVNWEFYKGFYNKPWVYSVIPNMGGKCGLTGVLDFYANGHWEALRSANKGNLVAFGMAPEGIENNEVIYELLSDTGWADKEIDLRQWLKDYSICRYGSYSEELQAFWNHMLASVYGTFTDHPRYNWQFRPSATSRGSINACESFYQGIEKLMNAPEALKKSELFQYDLAQWAAAYVGGKLELLTKHIERAYEEENLMLAHSLETQFESLMLRMDALLSPFPTTNMQEWVDKARAYGTTQQQADKYESNARRIITIWGPPIDDYSARIWSGLIRDYYLPRWKAYFAQKKSGKSFDFAKWEAQWVEKTQGFSKVVAPKDIAQEAIRLIQDAYFIQPVGEAVSKLGSWTKADVKTNWKEMEWSISKSQLNNLKGIRVRAKGGDVTIASVSLWADGKNVKEVNEEKTTSPTCYYDFVCDKNIAGNNTLVLKIKFKQSQDKASSGSLEAVY